MKTKTFLLVILINFLYSCKKESLPEVSELDPELTFQGSFDGQVQSISAGKDDYYMYTSKSINQDGINVYSSEFRKTTCNNCAESLKISFIDYSSSANQTDSSFYVGYYNFATASGKASRYNVSFNKTTSGPPNSEISWDFNDNSYSSEFNPTHLFVRPGKYDVCAEAIFVDQTSSDLCQQISLGNVGEFLEVNLNVGTIIGKSVNFSSNINFGTSPYIYEWDFGDGVTSSEPNLIHTYANEGVYTVSLSVTDANGVVETKKQNIRTENSNAGVLRFNYLINPILNPLNLGNVIIEWKDNNGVAYTSKNDAQPTSSFFRIISIEDYLLNENNQATKKIKIEFSCTLYNGTNQIQLKNAIATIAIAY